MWNEHRLPAHFRPLGRRKHEQYPHEEGACGAGECGAGEALPAQLEGLESAVDAQPAAAKSESARAQGAAHRESPSSRLVAPSSRNEGRGRRRWRRPTRGQHQAARPKTSLTAPFQKPLRLTPMPTRPPAPSRAPSWKQAHRQAEKVGLGEDAEQLVVVADNRQAYLFLSRIRAASATGRSGPTVTTSRCMTSITGTVTNTCL